PAGAAASTSPVAPTRAAASASPPPAASSASAPAHDQTLTDTQALRILESRVTPGSTPRLGAEASAVPLLRPEDTSTLRALRDAVRENAPVSFAIQLQWSVEPIDMQRIPPLAIFSAYTLYSVEGSRGGRRWYGLRLGFFSDAISAKQVAQYVRSDFA